LALISPITDACKAKWLGTASGAKLGARPELSRAVYRPFANPISPLCLAALGLALLPAHAAVAATPGTSATTCHHLLPIGAWNLQWLGSAKAGHRKAQAPEDIASLLQFAAVDILAMEEVSATGQDAQGHARNDTLDAVFAQLNQAGAQWAYALFPKRDGARAPQDQWTGLAWNAAAVTPVAGPVRLEARIDAAREDAIRQRLDTPDANTVVWSRWPQAMKFSAGKGLSDFVVLPIHLKSNIGGEATAQARAYEAELIVQGLAHLPAALRDEDVIILGDSNLLQADEPAAQTLQQAGFKDCNARDIGTHLSFRKGEKRAPFDRIFVKAAQPETAGTCPADGKGQGPRDFKVIKPQDWQADISNSQFQQRLSDHLLVRTTLCVMKDDD
jgi:predicted extracellular nuclease